MRVTAEVNEPSEVDRAWAAGIIDGEGCIAVYKQKSGWTLYVRVNMTEEDTIIELANIFGVGAILTQPKGRHKTQYHWVVSTRQAAAVLKLIIPYLRNKKEQARLAIEFQAPIAKRARVSPLEQARREAYALRIRALKNSALPSKHFQPTNSIKVVRSE